MKRTIKRLVVAFALIFATVFVVVAPASPALATTCPTGPRVCTWINSNQGGALYYYTGPTGSPGACINFGGSFDNSVSSVYNRFGGYQVRFYTNHDCNPIIGIGLTLTLSYGPCGGNVTGVLNDQLSSMRIGL